MTIELLASARNIPLVLHGGLIDPDSYMRLVRIRQGLAAGHLVNLVRRDDSGAPLLIEWSRLFDGAIVALAAPLAPWIGWNRAVFAAGVATGPLSAGFLGTALAYAAAAATPGARAFLWTAPVIGMLMPGICGFAGFGTVHYHIAQLALVALTAGLALRAPRGPGPAWACGIAGGVALWMMPETMPFVLLCYAALGFVWLFRPIGGVLARVGSGFLLTLVAALALDPPHGGMLIVETDRLSIVYTALGFAAGAAALWLALLDRLELRYRALPGIGGAALAFGAWLAAYPSVALGPFGLIPPKLMHVFFGNMSETQPVRGFGEAALLLGPGALALLYALHRAWWAEQGRMEAGVWLILGLGIALSLALTARFVIFEQYPAGAAAALLPVALGDISARLAGRARAAAAGRIGAIALVLLLPYGPAMAEAAVRPAPKPPRCLLRHVAPMMRVAAGQVVLTPMQDVPELLYRTRIIGVGSLYQHGIDGYLRAWNAWRAPAGSAPSAALLATGARFVLFCPGGRHDPLARGGTADSLWRSLGAGRVPPWLEPIGRQHDLRLFRILPQTTKNGRGMPPPA